MIRTEPKVIDIGYKVVMKTDYLIYAAIILILAISGCGGRKGVPGIAERANEFPPLPARDTVNRQAYLDFINGDILEQLGDIQSANHYYEEALKTYPESRELRYAYAETFFRMNDFRHAINELEKVKNHEAEGWLLIADSYRALGIDDSALSGYLAAVKLDTNNIGAFHYIAAYYQQMNNLDSALWAYENVARLSPSYRVFQEIANLQMRLGKTSEALNNYQQSISLYGGPDNVRSYLGISVILEDKGDSTGAKDYLEKAARLSPQNALIQTRLLGFYEDANELDKAIKTARTIIPLAPQDKNIVRRLGILLFNADSLKQADSIFSALLDEGDESAVNRFYLGRILFLEKKYGDAAASFTKVTEMADSVSDGWLNLGLAYHEMDSSRKELATYQDALKHMRNIDDSIRVMFILGSAQDNSHDLSGAIETFETILRIRPDHAPSLNYLAYMLAVNNERLDYAEELIRKALAMQPENGAYIDSYGWVLYKKGEYKSALKELLKANQAIDNDPTVLEHLGDAYEALGDSANARVYWEKAIKIVPDNRDLKEKLSK
ncbi:hypothetical protein TRIP_C21516 [Candidatus Zixiibacteriota bacterium]|nr:hypothetical protein TRIP_C21516 [candidate division Zixibacteria bacterium]